MIRFTIDSPHDAPGYVLIAQADGALDTLMSQPLDETAVALPENDMNDKTLTEVTAALDALRTKGVTTLAEVQIILAVAGKPDGVVIAELVKRMRMPFSTASRVIWNLSDGAESCLGLLHIKPHATDRRKKIVFLSADGQRVLRKAMPMAVAA